MHKTPLMLKPSSFLLVNMVNLSECLLKWLFYAKFCRINGTAKPLKNAKNGIQTANHIQWEAKALTLWPSSSFRSAVVVREPVTAVSGKFSWKRFSSREECGFSSCRKVQSGKYSLTCKIESLNCYLKLFQCEKQNVPSVFRRSSVCFRSSSALHCSSSALHCMSSTLSWSDSRLCVEARRRERRGPLTSLRGEKTGAGTILPSSFSLRAAVSSLISSSRSFNK